MENLAGEREVTVLIKYPKETEKRNKIFFEKKDQELTNLDWAKWSGWFDTDGSFSSQIYTYKKQKSAPHLRQVNSLKLNDKQPVELFSKTFETSLSCSTWKTTTPEPYKKEYMVTVYQAALLADKAVWFTKNVYPFLIKEEKKDYAAKLLGYKPESKDFADWTPEEVRNYLATAIEGDGGIVIRVGKKAISIRAHVTSSEVQYLSDLRNITEKKLGTLFNLSEVGRYKTKKGIKTKYMMYIDDSQIMQKNLDFFQSLLEEGVMTLDRKKQKVQEFVNQ